MEFTMAYTTDVTLGLKVNQTSVQGPYQIPVDAPIPFTIAIPKAQIDGTGKRQPGTGDMYLLNCDQKYVAYLLISASAEDGKNPYERGTGDCRQTLKWKIDTGKTDAVIKFQAADDGYEDMQFPRFYDSNTRSLLPPALGWVHFRNNLDVAVTVTALLGQNFPTPPAQPPSAPSKDKRGAAQVEADE
jgi:hypothetical protein